MNTPKHENFQQFIARLYRDAVTDPLTRYEPARAIRTAAVRRGNARKVANDRANRIFDQLTRKGDAV